jgi:hypothetical protein
LQNLKQQGVSGAFFPEKGIVPSPFIRPEVFRQCSHPGLIAGQSRIFILWRIESPAISGVIFPVHPCRNNSAGVKIVLDKVLEIFLSRTSTLLSPKNPLREINWSFSNEKCGFFSHSGNPAVPDYSRNC